MNKGAIFINKNALAADLNFEEEWPEIKLLVKNLETTQSD